MGTLSNKERKFDISVVIGERIRSERERKGWSQTKFISELGLYSDHSRVSKWENGNVIPGDDMLRKMASVFGCDYGYLIGEYPQRTRTEADIKAVTGLSDKAVAAITYANSNKVQPGMIFLDSNNSPKNMLDKLLQDDRFHEVLTLIGRYYFFTQHIDTYESAYQEMVDLNSQELESALATIYTAGKTVMGADKAAEHDLYLACEKFKEIVRDFSKKEKEASSKNGKE